MPPAMKTCRTASADSGKVQRGSETPSVSPDASASCSQAEPPRPAASRFTATTQRSCSAGSPQSE
ncbi:hypothetical protein ACFQU2_30705 [Siccirubricoccus deserti]